MSRLLVAIAALTAAAALAASSLAPESAEAHKPRGPKGLIASLQPFSSGDTERGMVHVRAGRGGSAQIIAVLIGLAAGNQPQPESFSLNFTKISCAELRRNPDAVTGGTIPVYSFNPDGDVHYRESDFNFGARQLRGVKSVVLVGGDGDNRIEACGRASAVDHYIAEIR